MIFDQATFVHLLDEVVDGGAPPRVEAVDRSAVIACWPEPRDTVVENPAGGLGQDCIVVNVAVALLNRRKDAVALVPRRAPRRNRRLASYEDARWTCRTPLPRQ